MTKVSTLSRRFVELSSQLDAVLATKHYVQGSYLSGDYVDNEMRINWQVKARNLLSMACGKDSEHYMYFLEAENSSVYGTNYDIIAKLKAVFDAAREDYDGGYLKSIRNIVQAEVFDNELDQSRELLSNGYTTAAAVIAGVVLETTLRQICLDEGIPVGKLDKMNADLAKAGRYNLLIQKRITALADIRNSAAHGHPERFSEKDVKEMIRQVESFVVDHL